MSDRIVISKDGAWQVGDLVSSLGGGGNGGTISIDTSGFNAGDPVCIDNTGTVQLASNMADETATAFIGIVASTPNTVIIAGQADGFIGLTPGTRYFLGDGFVTSIPPTTDGYHVIRVGIALSATSLVVGIQHICIL